MTNIEIVLRKIENHENKEVVKERRLIFLSQHKINELKKDKGLLGELLRETDE